MLQKDCECGEREMKKWKQNWGEFFMGEVRRKRKREKREKKEGREREKIKCHKMFRDRKG
jgi:hypothetical protein